MNEDFSEYRDLIERIKATPQVPVPDNFTESVMGRLTDEQRLSILQLLRLTLAETGKIPLARFTSECAQGRNAGFYFLVAGFFFFFIGSVLFSSAFYIEYATRAMGFILIQSTLIIMAAIALVMGGMMMATDMPISALWAKRAIIVYYMLITLSAALITVAVKTTMGGLLALIFGIAGIVTGMTLMKAVEKRAQGNNEILTGELHNA